MTRTLLATIAAVAAGVIGSVVLAAPAPAVRRTGDGLEPADHIGDAVAAKPLVGKVIVIDPGHQLGNAAHPRQINRLVNAGGFMKACNTTGTATNGGFPEATFAWKVANALARQLRARGARVIMTRHTNSYDDWGPCIDVRGRAGNRAHADAKVSIHGDGAVASVRGFFVIRPADRRGWTGDIYGSSTRLAKRVKAGLVRAGARPSTSYGGDGLDVRGDLGTLNWSNRPAVLVELGNMRNARDARHMTTPKYRRHVYARGLRLGLTRFVLR
jgi:N-acetylmuramoyl-L-alanine amidase